jgi:hypothetical protein
LNRCDLHYIANVELVNPLALIEEPEYVAHVYLPFFGFRTFLKYGGNVDPVPRLVDILICIESILN